MSWCARTAAVAVTIGLAGCGGGDDDVAETRTVTTETSKVEVVGESPAAAGTFDPAAIYAREAPGVVTIYSLSGSLLDGDGEGGQGSGFVLNGDGEVVTNAHVVTRGENEEIEVVEDVYVEFSDGNRVPADVLGFDPNADVALLKIDPAGLALRPLPFGDSDAVEVGEPVAAIGSPFGERQSLSVGIVSAVDRDAQSLNEEFSIPGAIQTDAAINPGNSGGPLVDAGGRVIGLNQSIETGSGASAGVGFAVPSNLAQRSVDQIRENGEVDYAFLGVSTTTVYPQLAERFDLPVDEGAWVQEVTIDGPSEDAGLRAGGTEDDAVPFQAQPVIDGGDIITRVGDFPIVSPSDLSEAVARLNPGDEVPVVIYRDNERRSVSLTLGLRPGG
ncbi:MAG: trypsin-like peptidase domain-containing protein [Solirubrobacteraceae bacterium]